MIICRFIAKPSFGRFITELKMVHPRDANRSKILDQAIIPSDRQQKKKKENLPYSGLYRPS